MSQAQSHAVRINLEISVPVGGNVQVRGGDGQYGEAGKPQYEVLSITHPEEDNDTTFVKQRNGDGRYYMCAVGRSDWHVFAKVYDGDPPGDLTAPPPNDLDVPWTKPIDGIWKFPLLFVPDTIGEGNLKTLVVWEWDEGVQEYKHEPRKFYATASTYTFCDPPGVMAEARKAKKPAAKDWSTLPDRWQFQIAGVSNAASSNCACLNGTWLLRRDGERLWSCRLDASVSDARQPSWWRLSFNQKDGFWYLECVDDPRQPVAPPITYRRHESAWDPHGANDLLLLTDHGYCNVPDFVTLYPA